MRLAFLGGVFVALSCLSSDAQQPQATLKYVVITGAEAKRIDSVCAIIWDDDEEVIAFQYRSRTYLVRTGPRNSGRACRQ